TERPAQAHGRLLLDADRLLEGIALDVLDQGEVKRDERHDPASRPGLRHGVVHLPVLVAHRGRGRSREIEEVITRRLVGLALEKIPLVEAVQRGLDDARVLALLDLLLQPVALWTTGDVLQRRKQLAVYRPRLDDPGPADHHRGAVAAFPGLAFLTLEGSDPAVREADHLGPVVVVKTTKVLLRWPMASSFFSPSPMLSSICFMPASLTPQSLPPFSPTMASYFGGSTVTTCMRAGLYQTKNGLF